MSTKVKYDDVDDVIGAAAAAMEQEEAFLSVEELEGVAAELDIPARLVGPAIDEVRRRRASELAREQAADATATRRRRQALIAGGIALVVVAAWATIARANLRSALLDADRQRSQVVNVLDRQRATEAQWAESPDSADKQAELSGADNRVWVERKRYDDLVTEYQRHATGLWGSVWVRWAGYPETLPLSADIDGW